MYQIRSRLQSKQKDEYGFLELFKPLGSFGVILTFFLTVLFWLWNIHTSYEPNYLDLVLNIIFIGIPSFFIAFIGFRGFLRTGIWAVLWLGIGALTFGLATLISASLLGWSTNVAITMHNISVIIAAILFFYGGFFSLNQIPPLENRSRRSSTALQVYLGVLVLIIFITIISIQQILPTFFIEGTGGTMERNVIVGIAAALFFITGVMNYMQYSKSGSLLLYWYSLGLFLISLGMVGILIQTSTGTPLNWIGRIAQLLSGVYLLAAALVALKTARKNHLSTGEALASFFQEKKQNLNLLFDSVTDALIVNDPNFVITGWNKAAEKIYGWKAEEVIGKSIEFLNTEYMGISREEVVKKIIEQGSWSNEVEQTTKDGRTISIWGSALVIKDDSGKTIGFMSVNKDVTQRKRAEDALRENQSRLKTIFEAIPDVIIEYDAQGKAIMANDAALKIIGFNSLNFTRDQVIKKLKFMNPDGSTVKTEDVPTSRALRGKTVAGDLYLIRIEDEIERIISTYAAPIHKDDEVIGVLSIWHDITELKKVEAELKEAHDNLELKVQERTGELDVLIDELKHSNEELERFAYIASHDLQEPLRTIASFTQLLERRYKGRFDEDADEFMDYIVEAAVRMKAQIEGLLEYSRVARKGKEFESVDMNLILNQTIQNLNASIEESNAEIIMDELPSVIGDAAQLQRVLQNLISNAIRFRKFEEPLEIHISSYEDRDEYVFSIKDNGIGIEEQYFERIFLIFQHLHTRDVYKGTGLGLSIVKRIVERHSGRVWIESKYGAGSVFYFTLSKTEGL